MAAKKYTLALPPRLGGDGGKKKLAHLRTFKGVGTIRSGEFPKGDKRNDCSESIEVTLTDSQMLGFVGKDIAIIKAISEPAKKALAAAEQLLKSGMSHEIREKVAHNGVEEALKSAKADSEKEG